MKCYPSIGYQAPARAGLAAVRSPVPLRMLGNHRLYDLGSDSSKLVVFSLPTMRGSS